MQSYPLYTHNTVLFLLLDRSKYSVYVESYRWQIGLTFSSLWVRHSILTTSILGKCYDNSLHLGIIRDASPLPSPPTSPPTAVWCNLHTPRLRDSPLLASAEPFPDLPRFIEAPRLLPAVWPHHPFCCGTSRCSTTCLEVNFLDFLL